MSNSGFASLNLNPALIANLEALNYSEMTPIQEQSLPVILEGGDLIGQAKTGSGKTAAFGLGILNKLEVKKFRIQTLVLCPTRELADQVAKEIRTLGRQIHNIKVLTLCGGTAFGPQKGSLEHGAHIVVGTPGRIEEHLRKGNLKLENATMFVLDEADRMLDMGFSDVIQEIAGYLPKDRQTLLFSATYPHNIDVLAKKLLRKPKRVEVVDQHDASTIKQLLYNIGDKSKRTDALLGVLAEHEPVSALIFCNTKLLTEEVAASLKESGFSAMALHGDLIQKDREYRLVQFANKSLSVLVATDVAARGLDIESLDLVVNYHLSRDPEIHTHRIGRTGRAGQVGLACSLFHDSEEHKIEILEAELEEPIQRKRALSFSRQFQPKPPRMVSLQIDGGKKQKLRPGDILGALTGDATAGRIKGSAVGKISLFELSAFVAIERASWKQAIGILQNGKIKGRSFRVRKI